MTGRWPAVRQPGRAQGAHPSGDPRRGAGLSDRTSLVALSLRQVAKEVGIVPTAFYRHFDSIESLGLALVDESFVSLRAMLRDVRRGDAAFDDMVDRSITVLVEHVHQQRAHFLFIAGSGPPGPRVRAAISHQIELFERELAADLALLPGTARWSGEDLRVLSNLIVTAWSPPRRPS